MPEVGDIFRPLISIGKDPDACWEWTGKKLAGGYGCKQFDGRTLLAHRWVFQLFNGWVPKEAVVNHLCRNRSCVNPKHLELTTTAGNCRHGNGSKLTAEQVAEIKRLLIASSKQGTRKRIAEQFGVNPNTISSIKYGRAWKDIAPAPSE